MSTETRPATLADLKLVLGTLNTYKVPYFLIGGYALATHGYLRGTTDIDISVPGDARTGAIIKQALSTLPDRAAAEIEPGWFEEGENIRILDEFVIDLMLNANGQTFEMLAPYAQTLDLDGIPVQTISLEGLLLTKRTMRPKDAIDCITIERALKAIADLQRNEEASDFREFQPKG